MALPLGWFWDKATMARANTVIAHMIYTPFWDTVGRDSRVTDENLDGTDVCESRRALGGRHIRLADEFERRCSRYSVMHPP
jgi:hypothetical protein